MKTTKTNLVNKVNTSTTSNTKLRTCPEESKVSTMELSMDLATRRWRWKRKRRIDIELLVEPSDSALTINKSLRLNGV